MTPPAEDDFREERGDHVIAGEYVLGTLDAAERQRVEVRMRNDSAFMALVRDWEAKLEPFDAAYGEAAPPPATLQKIERRLFGEEAKNRPFLSRLWQSASLWRGVALGAVVIAGVFVAGNYRMFMPQPPTLSAELSGPDNAVNLVARYNARTGVVSITPVAAGTGNDKSLELWLIEGENAPVPLGVLPQTGEGQISVPRDISDRIGAGAYFAVSIEPYGGSPTGAPTGPVIAVGELQSL